VARRVGGIETFQPVDGWNARLRIVEGEELPEDSRSLQLRYLLAAETPLLLHVPGGVAGADGVDGLFRDYQRRITEGEIVEFSSDGRLFDARCTAAVKVVVALTALERAVEEHQQRWNITQVRLSQGSPANLLRTPLFRVLGAGIDSFSRRLLALLAW
jgi:hypothetical protein